MAYCFTLPPHIYRPEPHSLHFFSSLSSFVRCACERVSRLSYFLFICRTVKNVGDALQTEHSFCSVPRNSRQTEQWRKREKERSPSPSFHLPAHFSSSWMIIVSSCLSQTHLLIVLAGSTASLSSSRFGLLFADSYVWLPWSSLTDCASPISLGFPTGALTSRSTLFVIQQESTNMDRLISLPASPRLEPRTFQETQLYASYVMLKKSDCIQNVSAQHNHDAYDVMWRLTRRVFDWEVQITGVVAVPVLLIHSQLAQT